MTLSPGLSGQTGIMNYHATPRKLIKMGECCPREDVSQEELWLLTI